MKKAVLLLFAIFLSTIVHAQKTKPAKKPFGPKSTAVKQAPKPQVAKAEVKPPLDEAAEYQKASSLELAAERVDALKKFLASFPASERRKDAIELIASSRVLIAEEKLFTGDVAGATALFKLAIEEGPDPFSNEFFNESISRIPASLYWRGARAEGLEMAGLIEKRAAASPAQLVELANFYIGLENGAEALRLGLAAAALDEKSEAAHRTIALAHRVNFDLEESAKAYARAIEVDPTSFSAKRGLAEMKRALGKADEAIQLYRELLEKNENDLPARTGLVLSLFNAGKRADAESEMAKALKATPSNVILLAGAAYWYAAQNEGDKAVELAKKAVELEPRYIWSHIALARGLMSQKKPVDAEQTLISARRYGNFPTLEYEIASARAMAGFYREAAEELRKSFTISEGAVQTKLGGRITRSEKSLADLIAYERRASIFEPTSPDSAEQAAQLKALLEFTEKMEAASPDESAVSTAADAFVQGSDKMKLHRQLYAANDLLRKKLALDKVLELSQAAVGNADAGLEAPNASAAVMASELYEARSTAFARSEFLLVPDVPKQTLSAILRGRIEDTIGWTLYQQNRFPEAAVRLRRAISVLPDKSAWWRASMWRLGAALEADGKEKEALSAYIQSYKTDRPDYAKFLVVESLYKRVNGSTDGLEEQIGRERVAGVTAAVTETLPISTPSPTPQTPLRVEVPKLDSRAFSIPRSVPVSTEEVRTDAGQKAQAPEKKEAAEAKVETVEKSVTEPVGTTIQPVKTVAPAETKPDAVKEDPAAAESKLQPEVKKEEPGPQKKIANQQPEVEKKVESDAAVKTEPEKSEPEKSEAKEADPSTAGTVEAKIVDSTTDKPSTAGETKTKKTDQPSEARIEQTSTTVDPAVTKEEAKKTEPSRDETVAKDKEKKTDEPKPETTPVEEAAKKSEDKKAEEPKRERSSEKQTEPPQPEIDPPVPTESKEPDKIAEAAADAGKTKTSEAKQAVVVTDNVPPYREIGKKKPTSPKASDKTTALEKTLFEPIVIAVPERSGRSAPPETKNTENAGAEESKVELPPGPSPAGLFRKRIIEFGEVKPKPCTIAASRDAVSIAGNGRIGLLVRLEGEADIAAMNAKSSSADDIAVTAEPEIAGLENQRVFVIRSISGNRGVYSVVFEMSCGRKEVAVNVR